MPNITNNLITLLNNDPAFMAVVLGMVLATTMFTFWYPIQEYSKNRPPVFLPLISLLIFIPTLIFFVLCIRLILGRF